MGETALLVDGDGEALAATDSDGETLSVAMTLAPGERVSDGDAASEAEAEGEAACEADRDADSESEDVAASDGVGDVDTLRHCTCSTPLFPVPEPGSPPMFALDRVTEQEAAPMTHVARATPSDSALLQLPLAHLPHDPAGLPYMATSTFEMPVPAGHVTVATPFSGTILEHAVVVVTVHSTWPAARSRARQEGPSSLHEEGERNQAIASASKSTHQKSFQCRNKGRQVPQLMR